MSAKETILLVGAPGTGKTTWLCQMIVNNPDQPVWIFDNERKVRGTFDLFGGVPDNVVQIFNPTTFPDTVAALEDEIMPELEGENEGHGIVAIDMVNTFWERAQQHYIHSLMEGATSLPDHMLEKLKQWQEDVDTGKRKNVGTAANPFEGFTDWVIIKQWHNGRLIEPILYNLPCHVIANTSSREIRDDERSPIRDAPKRVNFWRPFNAIPEGEKGNDFRFTTILGIDSRGATKKQYDLSLLKDRQRVLGEVEEYFFDSDITPDPGECATKGCSCFDQGLKKKSDCKCVKKGRGKHSHKPSTVFDIWSEFVSRRTNAPEILLESEK